MSTTPEMAEAIAAVRPLLPDWVVWGRDLFLIVAAIVYPFVGTWLAARFAFSPLRKQKEPLFWVEKARLAYPGRMAVRICWMWFTTIFAVAGIYYGSVFSVLSDPIRGLLLGVLAFFSVLPVSCAVENQ